MHIEKEFFLGSSSEEYRKQFDRAHQLIQEGEYELARDTFQKLTTIRPDDSGVWINYISILGRLREHKTLKYVLQLCLELFPNDPWYILAWSRTSDAVADWDEAIYRREYMLSIHDVRSDPRLLPLIHEQYLALQLCGRFDDLKKLIDTYEDVLLNAKQESSAIYYGFEILGDYERRSRFCKNFLDSLDIVEPIHDGRNIANMKLIADEAIINYTWLKEKANHIRLLSLGQLCLPFNIFGRWGLNNYVAMHHERTVFDLGITNKDILTDALDKDFSNYLDRDNYFERDDQYGAPQLWNKPLGIYFGHEKGRTLLGENYNRFFIDMNNKVNAFKNATNSNDHCLFVYGIVGECTLDKIANSVLPLLEKNPKNRFLMINLMRENLSFNHSSSRIRLVNIPYPVDYGWNDPLGFASERGFSFESRIISEIKYEMLQML